MGFTTTFTRWFHRMASPRWFYQFAQRWQPRFGWSSLLLLLVGAVWGLAFAPPDYLQGNSFRIIYIHVPAAILAQSGYLLMALAGGIGLIWRIKLAEMVAKSCAPIGASFTFLALVTGAIWGKPTWGTWWVWDARITSMLILLFLYCGVIALQSAIDNATTAARAAAILALVGVVNIPIIKYSVEWWHSLHQPATFRLTEKPAMPMEMWLPLLVMVVGYYLFFAAALLQRTRCELVERERKSRWVKELVENDEF